MDFKIFVFVGVDLPISEAWPRAPKPEPASYLLTPEGAISTRAGQVAPVMKNLIRILTKPFLLNRFQIFFINISIAGHLDNTWHFLPFLDHPFPGLTFGDLASYYLKSPFAR